MLLHLVGLGVGDLRPRCPCRGSPEPAELVSVASRSVSVASAPTISCSTRPVGLTAVGASSAATIVGAMSISAGGCSNGFTFGPTATIVPSIRWSPLTQSASS